MGFFATPTSHQTAASFMGGSGTSWNGVVVCLTLLLLLAPTPAPATFDLSAILSGVLSTASEQLYSKEEIILYDHYCTLSRSPYIKNWLLHYKAYVYCPGWSSIIGKGKDLRSPLKTERLATMDFVRQALASNLITPEDASLWI